MFVLFVLYLCCICVVLQMKFDLSCVFVLFVLHLICVRVVYVVFLPGICVEVKLVFAHVSWLVVQLSCKGLQSDFNNTTIKRAT